MMLISAHVDGWTGPGSKGYYQVGSGGKDTKRYMALYKHDKLLANGQNVGMATSRPQIVQGPSIGHG